MPCGRSAATRDPAVIGWFAALGVMLFAAGRRFGLRGAAAAGAASAIMTQAARPHFFRRVFQRSLDVQRELLRKNQVDAVVGSSFGGAVALALLASGEWRGPTVLLCPAHRLFAARAQTQPLELPSDSGPVVVVHGRQDETVPIEHSRALVAGTSARSIEVDDDHRLTATATPENLRAWVDSALSSQDQ
jgi:hypothetical protein